MPCVHRAVKSQSSKSDLQYIAEWQVHRQSWTPTSTLPTTGSQVLGAWRTCGCQQNPKTSRTYTGQRSDKKCVSCVDVTCEPCARMRAATASFHGMLAGCRNGVVDMPWFLCVCNNCRPSCLKRMLRLADSLISKDSSLLNVAMCQPSVKPNGCLRWPSRTRQRYTSMPAASRRPH